MLMKSLGIKLGDKAQIREVPSLQLLQSVTLRVSCVKEYSEVMLDKQSLSMILRVYHNNKAILSNSILFLPCLYSLFLAEVIACSPQQGVLSEGTKVFLEMADEKERGEDKHKTQLQIAKRIGTSIKYILDWKSMSSKLLDVNGIIVCGEKGTGKSSVLHYIVDELNRLNVDSSAFVSSKDLADFKWKYNCK